MKMWRSNTTMQNLGCTSLRVAMIAVFGLLVSSTAGCDKTKPANTGVIAGIVFDENRGVRDDATVVVSFATSGKVFTAVTDDIGTFEIRDVPLDGEFSVRPSDEAILGSAAGVLTDSTPQAAIRLATIPKGVGNVTGKVTDKAGTTVANIAVSLTFAEISLTLTSRTANDGTYSITNVPVKGNFTIVASRSTSESVEFGTRASYLTGQQSTVDLPITLAAAETIQPQLTNGDFRNGLAGWASTGDVNVTTLRELLKPAGFTRQASGPLLAAVAGEPPAAIVATAGPVPGSISQTFKVTAETKTLSGIIRFLSEEWPEYYGSEFNDAYAVTLVTPSGATILSSSNLNASSWSPGIAGFTGATPEIAVRASLASYVGSAVQLNVSVWNVADGLYPSAVALLGFNIPASGKPCDDATLTTQFGAQEAASEKGLGRQKVDSFDDKFTGPKGEKLRLLIEWMAGEVDIDAGLLAANTLHEDWSGNGYVTGKPVSNVLVGVDFWDSMKAGVIRDVPAAQRIAATKSSQHFTNELGQDTGPMYDFKNGPEALRAVAATLKHLQIQLANTMGASAWSNLPAGQQFTLTRMAYNQGLGAGKKLATSGNPILKPDGSLFGTSGAHNPQRHATQAAAQAIHISQKFFGNSHTC